MKDKLFILVYQHVYMYTEGCPIKRLRTNKIINSHNAV